LLSFYAERFEGNATMKCNNYPAGFIKGWAKKEMLLSFCQPECSAGKSNQGCNNYAAERIEG
jgi:hypothetical protein